MIAQERLQAVHKLSTTACGLVYTKRVCDLAVFDHRSATKTGVGNLAGAGNRGARRKLGFALISALAEAVAIARTGFAGVAESLNAVFPLEAAAGDNFAANRHARSTFGRRRFCTLNLNPLIGLGRRRDLPLPRMEQLTCGQGGERQAEEGGSHPGNRSKAGTPDGM